MIRDGLALTLGIATAVACAQQASQPVVPRAIGSHTVFTQSEVEQPAKLQDCPGRLAFASGRKAYRVIFELVVDSTGHVDPGTVVHILQADARRRAPDVAVETAKGIALTCLYSPARHQGNQVAVRLQESILVQNE